MLNNYSEVIEMEKTYRYVDQDGVVHDVVLAMSFYPDSETLAVFVVEVLPQGFEEILSTLTIKLEDSKYFATLSSGFIDLKLNGENIIQWLLDNNIGQRLL
jgi:hypothetical protein